MKLPDWLKRPSLNWLSKNDIRKVRDKIIGIYLVPGEFIDYHGIRVYGGAIPCFERDALYATRERAYFKYTKDKPPAWDLQTIQDLPGEKPNAWSKVKTVPFNAVEAGWATALVQSWHHSFPFKPTENFIGFVETPDPREN